jgi:hypothetical protein
MISPEQIHDFWDWFVEHSSNFDDSSQDEKWLGELDVAVSKLGDIAWEIGPGTKKENAFALSPAGNRNLLLVTDAIVATAPDVPQWEFYSTKPAKQYVPELQLQADDSSLVTIDTGAWRCVLLLYEDGFREVLVYAPNLNDVAEGRKQWAVDIVVDALLGERRRLESIDEVTLVPCFSEEEGKGAFPISEMPNRIK